MGRDQSEVREVPSRRDRLVAALSHLGVPIYGPVLPGVIFAVSRSSPFRRRHATQAFSFQCVFVAVWVVLVGLMFVGVNTNRETIEPQSLVWVLAAVMVLEAPNVAQAMRGRPPIRLVPFDILRP